MQKQTVVQDEASAISRDMRELYDELRAGGMKGKDADSLANVAGKNLKALAIIIADKMRESEQLSLVSRAKEVTGSVVAIADKK